MNTKVSLDEKLVEQIGEISYIPTPPVAHAVLRASAATLMITPLYQTDSWLTLPLIGLSALATYNGYRADEIILDYTNREFRPPHVPSSFYVEYANENLTKSQTRIGFTLGLTGFGLIADNHNAFMLAAAAGLLAMGKYAMRHLSDRHLFCPPE